VAKNTSVSQSPLILASASPRRRELLGQLGIAFEVITADIDEHDAQSAPHLTPVELARDNALRKAQAVADLNPARWVLGADTVVARDGHLLGKPSSLDEAGKFLRLLSGHVHEVTTGCVLIAPDSAAEVFHEISRVTFRVLSGDTIERYLAAVNVLDKAGAYALQEHGDWIIEGVEGSRANVIGLPVELLEKVLLRHGLL